MRRYLNDYLTLLIPVTLIVLFDQWTKGMIRTNLELYEQWAPWPWLLPYARFTHTWNTGSAFGLFQNYNAVFIVFAIIVSLFIVYYFPRIERSDWLVRLALILQMGGALGNFADRVVRGHVTDFISVGSFAVFNVADSCISIGVVVLMLGMYLKERQERALQQKAEDVAVQQSEKIVLEEGRSE